MWVKPGYQRPKWSARSSLSARVRTWSRGAGNNGPVSTVAASSFLNTAGKVGRVTVSERLAAGRRERRVLARVCRGPWRLEQAERERAWALASARAEGRHSPMLTVVRDDGWNERDAAGSSSLVDEIVREGARRILAEALQAEVDAYIARCRAVVAYPPGSGVPFPRQSGEPVEKTVGAEATAAAAYVTAGACILKCKAQ